MASVADITPLEPVKQVKRRRRKKVGSNHEQKGQGREKRPNITGEELGYKVGSNHEQKGQGREKRQNITEEEIEITDSRQRRQDNVGSISERKNQVPFSVLGGDKVLFRTAAKSRPVHSTVVHRDKNYQSDSSEVEPSGSGTGKEEEAGTEKEAGTGVVGRKEGVEFSWKLSQGRARIVVLGPLPAPPAKSPVKPKRRYRVEV